VSRARHVGRGAGTVYLDKPWTCPLDVHLVPDDGFDHDTSHVSMNCPCQPYPEEIPSLGGLYFGSMIRHREMGMPDHVPEDWTTDDLLEDSTEK
jgi:hypothetical protein